MRKIFENSTMRLTYDQERSLIVQHWSGDMTEQDYKSNMLALVDCILRLPPVHFNIVYPNLSFSISPHLQEWTKDHVFMATRHKELRKAAFIVPQMVLDQLVIAFLGVEQTMEETDKLFETRYFTTEQDAFEWFGQSSQTFSV